MMSQCEVSAGRGEAKDSPHGSFLQGFAVALGGTFPEPPQGVATFSPKFCRILTAPAPHLPAAHDCKGMQTHDLSGFRVSVKIKLTFFQCCSVHPCSFRSQ